MVAAGSCAHTIRPNPLLPTIPRSAALGTTTPSAWPRWLWACPSGCTSCRRTQCSSQRAWLSMLSAFSRCGQGGRCAPLTSATVGRLNWVAMPAVPGRAVARRPCMLPPHVIVRCMLSQQGCLRLSHPQLAEISSHIAAAVQEEYVARCGCSGGACPSARHHRAMCATCPTVSPCMPSPVCA